MQRSIAHRLPSTGASLQQPLHKLHPSCVKIANFGDRLTPLLLEKLLAPHFPIEDRVGVDDPCDGLKLFAIGTFLSREMLRSPGDVGPFIVLGTGAGYSDFPIIRTQGLGAKFPAKVGNALELPLPRQTPAANSWFRVYWVRGPLTARLMGWSDDLVVADAGYMVRQCGILPETQRLSKQGVAFMPHVTAANNVDGLQALCADLGIDYIDPMAAPEQVLASIGRSSLLLTEALHGAVIADALRVPWVPLKTSDDIFEFKWRDFCTSINVEYDPFPVRVRWNVFNFTGRNPRSMTKYVLNRARSKIGSWFTTPGDTAYDLILAMSRRPQLSSATELDRIDSEINRRLDLFIADVKSGTVLS